MQTYQLSLISESKDIKYKSIFYYLGDNLIRNKGLKNLCEAKWPLLNDLFISKNKI
jgi:hypothetical protein